MTSCGTGRCAALLTAAFLLSAATSPAGAEPPARNANIWNGHAHQPTQRNALRRERAAGVALAPRQRAAETAWTALTERAAQMAGVEPTAALDDAPSFGAGPSVSA